MDHPTMPAPEEPQHEPAQREPAPACAQPASIESKAEQAKLAGGDPEFVQAWEAKLRSMPLWLVLVGALALGLAAGGVIYLVRGVLMPLFTNTP